MKYYCILFLFFLSACEQKSSPDHKKSGEESASLANLIPKLRDTVNKKPVASYAIPIGDRRLDRKFGVEVYETKYTFKYLLVMQFDGMVQTDTLKLPDFDTWPVVKVQPGKTQLSCIIGFLDKEKSFREYKLLSADNDQLKLTVLQGYAVSEY